MIPLELSVSGTHSVLFILNYGPQLNNGTKLHSMCLDKCFYFLNETEHNRLDQENITRCYISQEQYHLVGLLFQLNMYIHLCVMM